MFLNDKEEKVIGKFMTCSDEYEQKPMILKWGNKTVVKAIYDSYIEDEADCEMDDSDYEEFWSFIFKVVDVSDKPPVFVTEDRYFCVNYHNFPDEIICDGKKIN